MLIILLRDCLASSGRERDSWECCMFEKVCSLQPDCMAPSFTSVQGEARGPRVKMHYHHSTALYCIIIPCTDLNYILLYCTELYYNIIYWIVLYFNILYCTVTYCTVISRTKFPRDSQYRMLVFPCTPRLESSYRHYPIYKCDEGLAKAIARAMNKAIAMSKPGAKKETIFRFFLFMVWMNNNNCSSIS